MACRTCGKSKAKLLAERSRAAGIEVTELGPFPNHVPAPAVTSSDDTIEAES